MTHVVFTDVLASFVPKLIRRRVIQDPRPISLPMAQIFPAVVLFADISGFTPLTERLAQKGPLGVETLARIINEYFGQLIDIVDDHGGDVVKFAGDALIAIWPIAPASDTFFDLAQSEIVPVPPVTARQWTLRAAECALEIRKRTANHQAAESKLRLKLALGTGKVTESDIGGVFNRWEFVLVGEPIVEVGIANSQAQAGDIIITQSAWALIKEDCIAQPFEFTLNEKPESAARLESLKNSSQLSVGEEALRVPDQAQAALRPYIPGAVLHRIEAGQSEWLAELRKVTVAFIHLSKLNDNTELENAQQILRTIQRLVYRFEGSITKISQDDKGVVIDTAFGLPPLAHADDPARGVQAAMMIRAELQAMGLRGSMGVTTGRMFCGLIGNHERREYGYFGSTVNLAARLMVLANIQRETAKQEGIAILCDQSTYEAVKERVEFEALGPQTVKGRTQLVEVFNPLYEKREVLRARTGLVGRREEKALLFNALQELRRGTSFSGTILSGEAGIGKSRLVEELIAEAQALHVKTFFGEADAIEKNTSYFVWRSVFAQAFGIEDHTSKSQLSDEDRLAARSTVLARLREIDPQLERSAPLLGVVLPVSIPENEFTLAMTGEVRGGNIRDLLVRVLQHEADQTPILVVIEDLHWIDSASWILLADVYQKVRRLLLVVDTRPLSPPIPTQFKELAERSDVKFVRLDLMSPEEVEKLVCQRLGVQAVPAVVGELIRQKSEGHPFFAEELAYAMRDSGVLLIEGQECRLAPGLQNLEALTLPDTLEATITSRIDGLNPSQQLALKVASVIGRIFAYRMLQAIHPIESDKPELQMQMDMLTQLRLTLIESEAPDLAYLFKHAVTQEVAYNLMLFAQRRRLHQAAAEWIEQNYPQDIEAFYPLLAHHWLQAAKMPEAAEGQVVVNKAVDYLEKAGDQSLKNFANAEALEFFHEILRLVDVGKVGKLRLGKWYRKLGEGYLGLGKLVEAKEYIVKAMGTLGLALPASDVGLIAGLLKEVARQTGHRFWHNHTRGKKVDPEEQAIRLEIINLTEKLAVVQFLNGDPNPLPMLFGVISGLNIAETLEDTPELWTMYANMSAVMDFVPLHSQARYYEARWSSLDKKINDPNAFIDGAIALCAVASGNGLWQQVTTLAERASAICEEMGDHRRNAEAVAYLGVDKLLEGGPKLAESYNKREWQIAMRRENPIHIAFAHQVDCTAMVWKGEHDECIANAKKCLALSEKSWVGDIPEYVVRSAMWLALWRKGERAGVWEPVKAALEKFAKASIVDYSVYLIDSHLAEITFLALKEGTKDNLPAAQMDEIEKYAKLAIKNLKKYFGVFAIGGPALNRYQGQLEWHHNRHAKAIQLWRAAAQKAHVFPIPYEEARAELLLGQYLPVDDVARENHLENARSLFKAIGCPAALGEIDPSGRT